MGPSQQTTLNKTTSGKIETLRPCLHDLQYTGQCFTFYMDVWQKWKWPEFWGAAGAQCCLGKGEMGIATVEEKVNQISRILLFYYASYDCGGTLICVQVKVDDYGLTSVLLTAILFCLHNL